MNISEVDLSRHSGDADRVGRTPAVSTPTSTEKLPGRLWVFTVVVLALEAATVLARLHRDVVPFVLVLVPLVAALLVIAAGGGKADVKRLFGRLGRWRVGWSWYAAALGIPVVEKLVVDLWGIALGETTPSRLVDALSGAAFVVPFVVVVPAILEEVGWRGPTGADRA